MEVLIVKKITLDLSKTVPFLNSHETDYLEEMITSAHNKLHNGTGAGSKL